MTDETQTEVPEGKTAGEVVTEAAVAKSIATGHGFDLAALETQIVNSTPFEFELKHPVTKRGLGMFITLLSEEHHSVQKFMRDRMDADIRAKERRERLGEDEPPTTLDDLTQRSIDLMVMATVGMRNVRIGDEVLPYSVTNARKMLQIKFVREQFKAAFENLENFIPA